jgi:hypothetical protein
MPIYAASARKAQLKAMMLRGDNFVKITNANALQ